MLYDAGPDDTDMRRLVLGFAVAALTFGAFLLVFDPGAMWDTLRTVSLVPFAVGLLAVLLAVGCWAESMRRVLLASGGQVGPLRGFAAYGAGMFAKQVLPMGNAGGPAIMALAIDREADIGFNRSLAVVTIGDFFGLLSTLVLAFVGVVYVVVTVPPSRLVQAVFVGVVIFGLVLVSVAVLLLYRRNALRYAALGVARFLRGTLGRLSTRIERALVPARVDASVQRYFDTVDAAGADRRSLVVALCLALAGWTLFAVPLYTSAAAVGSPLAFGLVLFIVPAGGLATAVPLPGGIGGVEFAVAGMTLALTAIDPAVVGAMVLLYRLCVYWFVVAIGTICLSYTATGLGVLTAEVSMGPEPEEPSKR